MMCSLCQIDWTMCLPKTEWLQENGHAPPIATVSLRLYRWDHCPETSEPPVQNSGAISRSSFCDFNRVKHMPRGDIQNIVCDDRC